MKGIVETKKMLDQEYQEYLSKVELKEFKIDILLELSQKDKKKSVMTYVNSIKMFFMTFLT